MSSNPPILALLGLVGSDFFCFFLAPDTSALASVSLGVAASFFGSSFRLRLRGVLPFGDWAWVGLLPFAAEEGPAEEGPPSAAGASRLFFCSCFFRGLTGFALCLAGLLPLPSGGAAETAAAAWSISGGTGGAAAAAELDPRFEAAAGACSWWGFRLRFRGFFGLALAEASSWSFPFWLLCCSGAGFAAAAVSVAAGAGFLSFSFRGELAPFGLDGSSAYNAGNLNAVSEELPSK